MTRLETVWLLLGALTALGVLIAAVVERTTESPKTPQPRKRRPIVVTCGECHVALCVVHTANDAALEDEMHRLLRHQVAA